jgi:hypothetical protein
LLCGQAEGAGQECHRILRQLDYLVVHLRLHGVHEISAMSWFTSTGPSAAAVAPTRKETLRECGRGPATRAGEGVSTGTGGLSVCTRGVRVRRMRALELARNQHAMCEHLEGL